MAAPTKKKLAMVKDTNVHPNYSNKAIQWSYCDTPEKDMVKGLMNPNTCRDSVSYHMMMGFNPGSGKKYKKLSTLKKRYFRLIAWFKRSSDDYKAEQTAAIKGGVHIVNCVERHFDWPLTKLHTVKNHLKYTDSFMIVGSGRWSRAPVMTFLYMLLLRMGKVKAVVNCKDYKELLAYWSSLKGNNFPEGSNGFSHPSDASYIKKCLYYLPVLMINFNEVFRGLTREQTWDHNKVSYGGGLAEITRILPSFKKYNTLDKVRKAGYSIHCTPAIPQRIHNILVKQGYYTPPAKKTVKKK